MNRAAVSSLRGLACLMLVLYHVVGDTPGHGLRLTAGPLRELCDLLAVVRMPLFALLAGAVHASSRYKGMQERLDGWTLMRDKFMRLLVPMLTVGTAFALVQSFTPGTNDNVSNWFTLHLMPVAHYWFLEALFLIFAVWTLASHSPLVRCRWVQVALASLAVTAYVSAWGSDWLAIRGAVYLLPFFGLGFWLVQHRVALRGCAAVLNAPPGLTLARWVGPMLWLAGVLSLAAADIGPGADRMTAAMLLSGALFASALWLMPVRHPLLAWIGERSYAIFLFHVFFTSAARLILGQLGWPVSGAGPGALAWHVALGVGAGVLGPLLLQVVLQRQAHLALCCLGQVPARPVKKRASLAASAADAMGRAA